MYILYGGGRTRSLMVEMVLAEGSIPYELRRIDTRKGEHRDPAFLAINPAGWVPVLVAPGGETVYETPAINLWLSERHAIPLVPPPGDPDRAAFLSAFFNVTGEIEPALKRIFYPHRYAPEPGQAEAALALARQALCDRLDPIERRLAGRGPFFLGDRFSLADLTLAYWMASPQTRDLLGALPAVVRARDLARARPALTKGFAEIAGWERPRG